LDLALQHGTPLLLVGPTGTGKSTYVGRHLLSGLPQDKWLPVLLTLSARTTANMTQDQVGCHGCGLRDDVVTHASVHWASDWDERPGLP